MGPLIIILPASSSAHGIVLYDAEMQARAVQPHIQAVHDVLNDLAEGQRDNGQIVALEPQDGNADDHTGNTCHNTAPTTMASSQAQGPLGTALWMLIAQLPRRKMRPRS